MNKTSSKSIFKIALLVVILALVFATMTACGGSSGGGEGGQDNDVSSLISLDSISGIQNATIDTGNKKVTANVSYEVTSLAASDLSFAVDAVAVEIYEDSKLTRRVSGDTVSLSVGQNTFYVYAYLPNRKNVNVTYEFVITRSGNGMSEGGVSDKVAFEIEKVSSVVTGSQYVAPRASDITPEQVKAAFGEGTIGELLSLVNGEEAEYVINNVAEIYAEGLSYAGVSNEKFTQTLSIVGDALDEIGLIPFIRRYSGEDEDAPDWIQTFVTAENVEIAIDALSDIMDLYDVNAIIAFAEYAFTNGISKLEGSSTGVIGNMSKGEIAELLEKNGVDASLLDVYRYGYNSGIEYAQKVLELAKSDNGVYVMTQLWNAIYAALNYNEEELDSVLKTLLPIVVSLTTEEDRSNLFATILENSLRDLLNSVKTIGKIALASINAMGKAETLTGAYRGVVTQIFTKYELGVPVMVSSIVYLCLNVEAQKVLFNVIANLKMGDVVILYDDIQTYNSLSGSQYNEESDTDGSKIAVMQLIKDAFEIVGDEWEGLSDNLKEEIDKTFRPAGLRSMVEFLNTLKDSLKDADTNAEFLQASKDMEENIEAEIGNKNFPRISKVVYLTEQTTKEELIEKLLKSLDEYYKTKIEKEDLEGYTYKVKSIFGRPYLEVSDSDGRVVKTIENIRLTEKTDDSYRLKLGGNIIAIRTPLGSRISKDRIENAMGSVYLYKGDGEVTNVWNYTIDLTRIIPTEKGIFAATMTVSAETGNGTTVSQTVPFVYYVYDPSDLQILDVQAWAEHACVVGDTEEQVRNVLAVEALYDDGEYRTVSDYRIRSFDSSVTGYKKLTIVYDGIESFVYVQFVEKIEIEDMWVRVNGEVLPNMTEEEFRDLLIVHVYYNTGESGIVEDYDLSGYVVPGTSGGSYTVTITYDDYSYELSYSVDFSSYNRELLREMLMDFAQFYDGSFDRIASAVENETTAKIALSGFISSSEFDFTGFSVVSNIGKNGSSAKVSLSIDGEETDWLKYIGGRLKVGEVGMDVSALSEEIDDVLWALLTYIARATEDVSIENDYFVAINDLMQSSIWNSIAKLFTISQEDDRYTIFMDAKTVRDIYGAFFPMLANNETIDFIRAFLGEDVQDDLANGRISITLTWKCGELSLTFANESDDEFVTIVVGAMEGTGALDAEIERELFTISPIRDNELKDIVLTIPVELEQKGLTATATVAIHTSDMFKAEGNDFITIILDINNVEHAMEYVINDKWLFLDITGLLDAFSVDPAGNTSYFSYFDEVGRSSEIIETLKNRLSDLAEKLLYSEEYDENASMCDVPYDEDGRIDPYYRQKLFPLYDWRDMTDDEFLQKLIAELINIWDEYVDDFVVDKREVENRTVVSLRISEKEAVERSIFDLIGEFVRLPEDGDNWNYMIPFGDIDNLISILNNDIPRRRDNEVSVIDGIFGVDYDDILRDLYVDIEIDPTEEALNVNFRSHNDLSYLRVGMDFDATAEDMHLVIDEEKILCADSFPMEENEENEIKHNFSYLGEDVYVYNNLSQILVDLTDAFLWYSGK